MWLNGPVQDPSVFGLQDISGSKEGSSSSGGDNLSCRGSISVDSRPDSFTIDILSFEDREGIRWVDVEWSSPPENNISDRSDSISWGNDPSADKSLFVNFTDRSTISLNDTNRFDSSNHSSSGFSTCAVTLSTAELELLGEFVTILVTNEGISRGGWWGNVAKGSQPTQTSSGLGVDVNIDAPTVSELIGDLTKNESLGCKLEVPSNSKFL